MAERHAATLARVAEAAERLAMMHLDRALSCDDPKIEAQATAAFHRATRALRQSLALEAKLVRDAERAGREAAARERVELGRRSDHRKARIRAAGTYLIWNEAENAAEAERLDGELDDLIDIEALTEGFTGADLDAQVSRLCAELGVTPSKPETPAEAPAPRPAPPFPPDLLGEVVARSP